MVVVQVPMTVVGVLLMEKSGRLPLLMISASGTCLGCFLIGLSFLLQDLLQWKYCPVLALVGILVMWFHSLVLPILNTMSIHPSVVLLSSFYGIFLVIIMCC